MTEYVTRAGIETDPKLAAFIETEVLGPLGRDVDGFWQGFAQLLGTFAPRNAALLAKREDLQAKIDAWHMDRAGQPHDAAAYRAFLEEIGYLVPEPGEFTIGTENVDPEIATMAGPQLVCSTPRMRAGAASTTHSTAPIRSTRRLQSRVAMMRRAARR